MRLERFRVKTPGMAALLARSLLCVTGLLLTLSPPVCEAFNLDVENPAVYSGPTGSYFGYAVDFYLADSSRWALIYLFFFIPNQQKQNESGLFRDKNLKHLFTVFNVGTNMLRANFPLVYIAGFFLCAKLQDIFTNPPVKVTARVSFLLFWKCWNHSCGFCCSCCSCCGSDIKFWVLCTYCDLWAHALRTAHTPSVRTQPSVIK